MHVFSLSHISLKHFQHNIQILGNLKYVVQKIIVFLFFRTISAIDLIFIRLFFTKQRLDLMSIQFQGPSYSIVSTPTCR